MLTEDFPSSEVSGPCHIVTPKYFKVTSAYDKIARVKTLLNKNIALCNE